MIFYDSITHKPHKDGLLKIDGKNTDKFDLKFLPSKSASNFVLSVYLSTIDYCYTLSGEDCSHSANCIQGCMNIEKRENIESNRESLTYELFAGETDEQTREDAKNTMLFVLLGLVITISLLVGVLCVLKRKCSDLPIFMTERERYKSSGGDITADKHSVDEVNISMT